MTDFAKLRGQQGFAGILGLLITVAIILILTSLYFTGGEDNPPPKGTDPADPMSAPPTAGGAIKAANYAKLKTRLLEIRQAIQGFEALHGRKPASIDELKNEDGFTIRELPEGHSYSYDPDTGIVAIKRGEKVVCD